MKQLEEGRKDDRDEPVCQRHESQKNEDGSVQEPKVKIDRCWRKT